MLIVLSPAKTLDFDTPATTDESTLPEFIPEAAKLIGRLRRLSPAKLTGLMDISDALAVLNAGRYSDWSPQFSRENAKQAMLAFDGDVYDGLDAVSFTPRQLAFAQSHLRILSGLYGILRPLDLMQPYRLEMGTRLATPGAKDLYAYWGDRITEAVNRAVDDCRAKTLVNLASEEYFKSVRSKLLQVPVVTPVFEDWKSGKYKVISFFAKRARGLMARYAVVNRITRAEKLKAFAVDGYRFDDAVSDASTWVFRRRLEVP